MYEIICRLILMSVMLLKVKSQGLCEMRIVFVLDSTGISDADWTTIKSFVQILANYVNITQDEGEMKSGLVRFESPNSQLKLTCNSMTTTAAFQSTLTNLQKSSGLTDIIGRLNAGREVMQSCSQDATTQNVAKYVVLMTDIMHNRPIGSTYNDIYAVADQIFADGVTIYGVAYGNTREAEMNIITENKLFSITQFSELDEQLAEDISDDLKCLPLMTTTVLTPSTTTTTSVTTTATPTKTNIVILTTAAPETTLTTLEISAAITLETSASTTMETSASTTEETSISTTLKTSVTITLKTSATTTLETSAATTEETSHITTLETSTSTTPESSATAIYATAPITRRTP